MSIYQDVITDALRHEYGGKRNAAKELARRLLKSPHTVRNWLRGTSTPRGEELLRLMVECKPLREKINQFIEENQQCSGE
ncbi:hypothetical protein [Acetobacter oeni]|uniref:HTH cro/C1-type domain-containing protein n=1 Tax=Acetobacter oeni TaxID=304077 RepID=A0A511XKX8_9PROT|nr:hypothetical protein [Acetobacter oeni]MBB3883826.1 DNA-binding transcriptional regulator YiaG [Acetobacter oeni]NHO19833.1 hypothetical protein [Acetobacter oeni]GBR10512.1 hypothetical protein AA21952_3098 [Acetobacter oeni LMG 21952]GEN63578.1 hypothetical protein AOE01nite_18020 [Acetobacter oeni]